jgi:hypothetical protein
MSRSIRQADHSELLHLQVCHAEMISQHHGPGLSGMPENGALKSSTASMKDCELHLTVHWRDFHRLDRIQSRILRSQEN